jgi:hypothetical protein
MKYRFLVLLPILLTAVPAMGGPDQTTQHLLSDPASMLDLGVLKANLALKERKLGFMGFDWDANRFFIVTWFSDRPDTKVAESDCVAWVADVRELGGIRAETGEPFLDDSFFAGYFSHEGFSRSNAPDTLYSDLDKLFELKCTGFVGTETVVVTAPLLGTTYSLERGPAN